eukprot:360781_1
MKFQLITWLTVCLGIMTIQSVKLPDLCPDYAFECPWDGDSFKMYTKWSGTKLRCVMQTNTQNVNKRMKQKCGNLGTCDGSATWYENVKMGCSVPEWAIRSESEQGKFIFPKLSDVTSIDEYSVLFKDACVMHDICYRSKNTKFRCDNEFLLNMGSMCAYVNLSPQTRYKEVSIRVNCPAWATIYWHAVSHHKGGQEAYNRQQQFHKDHHCENTCVSDDTILSTPPLTDEERKVEIKTLNGLIDQQKRDFESYNNNNYNPNNEPMAVLNDMEWKMNILIAF